MIKADGLARGKGVLILDSKEETIEKGSKLIIGELIKGVKGPVVIDEFLAGNELSAMAVVNGRNFVILPFVRDYKRLMDGDRGPNTGGMGSWGPVEIPSDTIKRSKSSSIRLCGEWRKKATRTGGSSTWVSCSTMVIPTYSSTT